MSPARATARRAPRRSPTSCRTPASRCRGSILVSCAMDLQSIVFAPRNDLPYALFLPAFACVAQYHGKLKGAPGRIARGGARRGGRVRRRRVSGRAARRGAAHQGDAAPHREARRGAHGARAGARRRKEPAHQRPDLLRRAAARPRPDRRPARGARHRADGGEPLARLGIRSRHRSDRRARTRWPRMRT